MKDKNGKNLEPATLPYPHGWPIVVSWVSYEHEYFSDKKYARANQAYTDGNKELGDESVLVSLLLHDQVVQGSPEGTVDPETEEKIQDRKREWNDQGDGSWDWRIVVDVEDTVVCGERSHVEERETQDLGLILLYSGDKDTIAQSYYKCDHSRKSIS